MKYLGLAFLAVGSLVFAGCNPTDTDTPPAGSNQNNSSPVADKSEVYVGTFDLVNSLTVSLQRPEGLVAVTETATTVEYVDHREYDSNGSEITSAASAVLKLTQGSNDFVFKLDPAEIRAIGPVKAYYLSAAATDQSRPISVATGEDEVYISQSDEWVGACYAPAGTDQFRRLMTLMVGTVGSVQGSFTTAGIFYGTMTWNASKGTTTDCE